MPKSSKQSSISDSLNDKYRKIMDNHYKYIRDKTLKRKGSDIRNTLIKSMQQTKNHTDSYLDDPFLLALIDEMRGSKKTRDIFDYYIKKNYQTFTNKTKTKILLDAVVRMQEEAVPSSQEWIVLLTSLNMSNSNSASGLRTKSRRKRTRKKRRTIKRQ